MNKFLMMAVLLFSSVMSVSAAPNKILLYDFKHSRACTGFAEEFFSNLQQELTVNGATASRIDDEIPALEHAGISLWDIADNPLSSMTFAQRNGFTTIVAGKIVRKRDNYLISCEVIDVRHVGKIGHIEKRLNRDFADDSLEIWASGFAAQIMSDISTPVDKKEIRSLNEKNIAKTIWTAGLAVVAVSAIAVLTSTEGDEKTPDNQAAETARNFIFEW